MNLVKDTCVKVALYLGFEDLKNFCESDGKYQVWVWDNYSFWYNRLIQDYSFQYKEEKDIKVIQYYYKSLYIILTKKNYDYIPYIPKTEKYSALMKHIKENTFKCEYTFLRGAQRGQKCNKLAAEYYGYYYCKTCIKKTNVKQQIVYLEVEQKYKEKIQKEKDAIKS